MSTTWRNAKHHQDNGKITCPICKQPTPGYVTLLDGRRVCLDCSRKPCSCSGDETGSEHAEHCEAVD